MLRLDVLRVTRLSLFSIVRYVLYLSLILGKDITRCSSLFVAGWCISWCTRLPLLTKDSDVGQANEALCKVLAHNICVLVQAIHELGIEPTF